MGARARLWLHYVIGGAAALAVPLRVFDGLLPWLYSVAKRRKAQARKQQRDEPEDES